MGAANERYFCLCIPSQHRLALDPTPTADRCRCCTALLHCACRCSQAQRCPPPACATGVNARGAVWRIWLGSNRSLVCHPSPTRSTQPNTPAGFDVRGAVRRIWLGSRDAHMLMMGKDAGSAAAIKQILFHAQQYDDKFGKQTYSPKSAS